MPKTPSHRIAPDRVLRALLEGTSTEIGEAFFDVLVKHLAQALGVRFAWVTELLEREQRLRALSFWTGEGYYRGYEYSIPGTPCEHVLQRRSLCRYGDRVFELFPDDPDLGPLGAVSYLGAPLLDTDGRVLGNLAVMDTGPMADEVEALETIFRIFASRAAAELRRIRRDVKLEQTRYLKEEIEELHGFAGILGRSPALRRVMQAIEQVAPSDATVLLIGETGVGKELIARALHQKSPRSDGPLVRVNCAAIPAQLQESEFFGHEKGAFTGATERRAGRFKLADGGTLFLDEVGELPPELQAKLLRVLQEGEFEPVGSSHTERVDVRLISATNRDLALMVDAGTFRRDLWYRLNVFPIRIPPLRERGDDVVLLAETFLQTFAQRLRKDPLDLDDGGRSRLRHYDWPGNVRELQNVIERAVILSPAGGPFLLPEALPCPAQALPAETPSAPQPAQSEIPILTQAELRELERRNICRALERCGGRVAGETGAARLLGLPPSTLASRMKALSIDRPAATR